MSAFIAALPMYDWPEIRTETDAAWARLRDRLRQQGIDAPERLVRRNADLPPVPGGIRDAAGNPIAADPASLPPDELDLAALWRHPRLLVSMACWGPLSEGLGAHVRVVGQSRYDGIEGGKAEEYSSVIVMRRDAGTPNGEEIARPVPAPKDGRPLLPLDGLRGRRFAFNAHDSMSGLIALRRDLIGIGAIPDEAAFLGFWSEMLQTGGHRDSVRAVARGLADVAAVDCRSWALALKFEPAAKRLAPAGWTGRSRGLPFISAGATQEPVLRVLRSLLGDFHSAGTACS